MPAAVRSLLRARAPLVVLGVLTLVGAPAAGEDDPATPPPAEINELLAEWIEEGSPPPPGRLMEILRALDDLPVPLAPNCQDFTCSPGPTPKEAELPPAPYRRGGDDCDLFGRTAEIENYVKALDAMLVECLAFAERSHEAAIAAKALLDSQIKVLPVGGDDPPSEGSDKRPPRVKVVWGGGIPAFEGVIESVGTKYTMFSPDGCARRTTTTSPGERSRDSFRRGDQAPGPGFFTEWLDELTHEVESLCEDTHRTYAPLEDACEVLKHLLCSQEGRLLDDFQRAQFLERLDVAMGEVVAAVERVRSRTAWLRARLQAFLEQLSDAILCTVAPTPDAVLARHAAEKEFQDFMRSVAEQAEFAWRPRVGVALWLGGRLYLFEVPTAPLR